MSFTVIYDACVLYPAPLRDLLLELAISELFSAKWTETIHDEWVRNLLKSRPELEERLIHTRKLMNKAVPDSLVENFESLIDGLELPDANDRHVLAAAIKCNAQIIVTSNLKDFPTESLHPYGIEAMHPDEFIEHQFGLSPGAGQSVNCVSQAAPIAPGWPGMAAPLSIRMRIRGSCLNSERAVATFAGVLGRAAHLVCWIGRAPAEAISL